MKMENLRKTMREIPLWLYMLIFWHVLGANLISWYCLTYIPNTGDEYSLIFQSKIFQSLQLTAPAPSDPQLYMTDYISVKEGRWFSQYPPIFSFFLIPGLLIGWPIIITSLFSGLSILGLFILLKRVFKETQNFAIAVTVILMAISPSQLFYSASSYNHSFALLILVGMLLTCFSHLDRPSSKKLILGAVLLGMGIGTRPYTFFLLSIPLIFEIFRFQLKTNRLKELLPGAVTLFLFMIGLVAYNHNQTGDWLQFSYLQAGDNAQKLSLSHFNWESFSRILRMLDGTSRWLLGVGYFASGNLRIIDPSDVNLGVGLFVISFVTLILRCRNQDAIFFRLCFLSLLLVVLGHLLYRYQGGRFGERFFFEISWIFLLGLGLVSQEIYHRLKSRTGKYSVIIFLIIMMFPTISVYLPGTMESLRDSSERRMDLFLQIEEKKIQNAVIHVGLVPDFYPAFYLRNDPFLEGNIFVKFTKENAAKMIEGYSTRKHYLYHYNRMTGETYFEIMTGE